VGKPEGKRFTESAKFDVTRQLTQNDQQFEPDKPRTNVNAIFNDFELHML
jgi:hypothetical protein